MNSAFDVQPQPPSESQSRKSKKPYSKKFMSNFRNVTAKTTRWHDVNWQNAFEDVRNLRRRIFKATQSKDWRKVRNLQKLMLRSYSNVLVSVRKATQDNKGHKTAGVDKVKDSSKLEDWNYPKKKPEYVT